MTENEYCDGQKRRDFLRVGALGAAGLTLPDFLRLSHGGDVHGGKAKSAIFINLGGGPTHLDTFDLKPKASAEFRGEFKPIATNVAGVEICEHLPNLARCADKYAVLRGVSHTFAAHEFGTKYMNTGNRPLPSLEYPSLGSVATKELQAQRDLPPFVAIPNTPQAPGFLGIAYAPFSTGNTPKLGQPYAVRGISLGRGMTIQSMERREKLLADVDTAFRGYEKSSQLLGGLDRFSQQAHDIIGSKAAREAFDIAKEPAALAKTFGDSAFGQSCLLACRLVQSGVRFVTVSFGGWDTHEGNFQRLKSNLLPQLDQGLAGLFTTLSARRLLDSTVVQVTGEFGRTPKINQRGGRDHWPRAMFVLMAGGGIRGGQVVGESDDKGMGPKSTPISPDDVAATFYSSLGIDIRKEYQTNTGRPVMIVRNGNRIDQLFG